MPTMQYGNVHPMCGKSPKNAQRQNALQRLRHGKHQKCHWRMQRFNQDMKKLIILSVLLAIGLFCLAYIKFTTFENADPIIQAIIYLLIAWGIGAKMLSAPATDADQIQTTLWLSSSNQ